MRHADADSATVRRAVVFGGGGLTGHSWLVG